MGQISQGVCFPLSILPDSIEVAEGLDVTTVLGIEKYEPPVPAQLSGIMKRGFPSFIPKTDETRVQILADLLEKYWILRPNLSTSDSIAIQGELIGEGIQGNKYKLKGQTVRFSMLLLSVITYTWTIWISESCWRPWQNTCSFSILEKKKGFTNF